MKRAATALLLLAFFLILVTLAPTRANPSFIAAKSTSSYLNVQVDQVTHSVQIQDGGLVIINDTLKISSESEDLLQNFSIGFPFPYAFSLDHCFAYQASNPDVQFEVKFDVGLGRIGFYGVNVIFPEPGVDISDGGSYVFTVVFVFSNLISLSHADETSVLFNVTFPMYPSLIQDASVCNTTVILPYGANHTDSVFQKESLNFTLTTLESRQMLRNTKISLDSYQHKRGWLEFNLTEYVFPLLEINEIKRKITLDQWGRLQLIDFYDITNKGSSLTSLTINLPEDASDVSAQDEIADLSVSFTEGNANTNATIDFRTVLNKDAEGEFSVTYRLPWKKYVNQHNWLDYDLTFTFFENFDWTIQELAVAVTLPEGAEFQSSNPDNPWKIEKSILQESVTFVFFNVTPFHDLDFNITYEYLVFWASFRPTLWIGILVIIVGAIVLFWRAPKPPSVPIVAVPQKDLKGFVEAYEGKTGILLELESMEQKLRRGRIPRRRYKVRKRMLEGRLSTLSRELTDLRGKMRAAGARYANIMRQIEVAETMLEGVETDIRRVESRYRRGEISKGAHRRLVEDCDRRKERAKTTIDEALLRLKEEIR